MAIKVMRAPDGAEEALRRGIMEMAAVDALDAGVRQVAGIESPMRVFALAASALKKDKPLGEAKHVAWRYTLLDERREPIGFAELMIGVRGSLRLAQVGGASAARSTHEALEAAEKSIVARTSTCEARLLRFPIAYLTAIWLVPATGKGEDSLVPVGPTPDGVQRHRSYTAVALFKAVKETVDKQLQIKVSRRRA
jgi:hypothetical protein